MSSSSSSHTLSEAASKELLAGFGVPFAPERKVTTPDAAASAAQELGFPVVVKLGGDKIAHKTERGLVRLRLADAEAVTQAAQDLLEAARPEDGEVHLLVAPMISGTRELIAGVLVDAQFGPTVMLGIGGIMAEVIADVQFRPAPLTREGAMGMISALRMQGLLGDFRGESAVNLNQVVDTLVGLSQVAVTRQDIVSVDVNPLIVKSNGDIVAVDALVELGTREVNSSMTRPTYSDAQFRALFEPKGVVVTGASTHPGKFGFVSLHNILASGYAGGV